VPYQENLELNYVRCLACGCIFNGAYHVRSFVKKDLEFLFNNFKCVSLKGIVHVQIPDRTISFELFIRHHLALEYLYSSPSVKCPLCYSEINKKPKRNLIGWFACGLRVFIRMLYRKKDRFGTLVFMRSISIYRAQ